MNPPNFRSRTSGHCKGNSPKGPKVGFTLRSATLLCALLVAGGLMPTGAQAQVLNLDYVFTPSGVPPAGAAPWLSATFVDTSPDHVELTLSVSSGLAIGEFVSKWYFNLDPAKNASNLVFTQTGFGGGAGGAEVDSISTSPPLNANGGGSYDFFFNFKSAGMGDRFTAGETLTYDITLTGAPVLSAADFFYLAAVGGGNGVYYSAAHIQGIDDPNNANPAKTTSVWIGNAGGPGSNIPEPSTYSLLFGLACVAGVLVSRGLRRKTQ